MCHRVAALRCTVVGPVPEPGAKEYAQECATFDLICELHAAVAVGAPGEQDVRTAIRFAALVRLPVAAKTFAHPGRCHDRGEVVEDLDVRRERDLLCGAGARHRIPGRRQPRAPGCRAPDSPRRSTARSAACPASRRRRACSDTRDSSRIPNEECGRAKPARVSSRRTWSRRRTAVKEDQAWSTAPGRRTRARLTPPRTSATARARTAPGFTAGGDTRAATQSCASPCSGRAAARSRR